MKIVRGNILDATDPVIAHQCNCVSTKAAGLAAQIFDRFPLSDTYQVAIRCEFTVAGADTGRWKTRGSAEHLCPALPRQAIRRVGFVKDEAEVFDRIASRIIRSVPSGVLGLAVVCGLWVSQR